MFLVFSSYTFVLIKCCVCHRVASRATAMTGIKIKETRDQHGNQSDDDRVRLYIVSSRLMVGKD